MKKTLLIGVFLMFLGSLFVLADEPFILIENRDDQTSKIKTKSEAVIGAERLTVNFTESVNIVNVRVTSNLGQIVAIQTIDTNTNTSWSVSTSSWAVGGYTLTIESLNEDDACIGEFDVE